MREAKWKPGKWVRLDDGRLGYVVEVYDQSSLLIRFGYRNCDTIFMNMGTAKMAYPKKDETWRWLHCDTHSRVQTMTFRAECDFNDRVKAQVLCQCLKPVNFGRGI